MRVRLIFLISSLWLLVACETKLSNKIDSTVFTCGEDFPSNAEFIRLSDSIGSSKFEVLGENKDRLKVSSKGCIERPKSGKVFVTNDNRTAGYWLSPSSAEKIALEPIPQVSLPSACSTIVHGDGAGFNLNIPTDVVRDDENLRSMSLSLLSVETKGVLVEWEQRLLNPTLVYTFPKRSSIHSGEYILRAVIEDKVKATSSSSDCLLRIDNTELVVLPADEIKTKRVFSGKEILIVEPGYAVNFYIQQGFRDVAIEYCLKKIKASDVGSVGTVEPCLDPINFLSSQSPRVDEGFWQLTFRGKRGLIQNDWQSSILLVEKVCTGDYRNTLTILQQGCTVLSGDLILDGDASLPNASDLDLIGEMFGRIQVYNMTNDKLNILPNLSQHLGAISIFNNSFKKFSGFNALKHLHGSLFVSQNSEVVEFEGFSNLMFVGTNIAIESNPKLTTINAFGALQSIQKSFSLADCRIEDLQSFKALSSVQDMNLSDLDKLKNFDGLTRLASISSLKLENLPALQSFKGLDSSFTEINKVEIVELANLISLSDLKINSIRELNIKDVPKLQSVFNSDSPVQLKEIFTLTGETEIKDLTGLKFSKKFNVIDLRDTNLSSLEGTEDIEELGSLNAENMANIGEGFQLIGLRTLEKLSFSNVGNGRFYGFDKLRSIESLSLFNRSHVMNLYLDGFQSLKNITSATIGGYTRVEASDHTRIKIDSLEYRMADNEAYISPDNFILNNVSVNTEVLHFMGDRPILSCTGDLTLYLNNQVMGLLGLERFSYKGKLILSALGNQIPGSNFIYSPLKSISNASGGLELGSGICPDLETIEAFAKNHSHVTLSERDDYISTRYPSVTVNRYSSCKDSYISP
ncbi:MAG: hypothetical protein EOP04_02890 [Proteobacteria bacterium]|nr:MAG: hypothetical protein EOP04_02890 [Pseudomonadota bacterium]